MMFVLDYRKNKKKYLFFFAIYEMLGPGLKKKTDGNVCDFSLTTFSQ